MSQVITTVLFNGQFWIALVEKYETDGSKKVGKYTFGPEPSNTDLLDFYINRNQDIRLYKTGPNLVRVREKYSMKEVSRNSRKSLNTFKENQQEYLNKKKSKRKLQMKINKEEKYKRMQVKKKAKKRGR